MVRFLVLYNEPLNSEAFERHYREVHIPLAKKLAGLRRYAISRNMSPVRGGALYYLVAELEWDDREALMRAFQSAEGKATADDVANNLERLAPGIRSMIYDVEDVFWPEASPFAASGA